MRAGSAGSSVAPRSPGLERAGSFIARATGTGTKARPAPAANPPETKDWRQSMQNKRFTRDGSSAFERELRETCAWILQEVQAVVPAAKLEGMVLGGGYGRGEGGVLQTADSERSYNDLEFYVFTRGPRLLNERAYGRP